MHLAVAIVQVHIPFISTIALNACMHVCVMDAFIIPVSSAILPLSLYFRFIKIQPNVVDYYP